MYDMKKVMKVIKQKKLIPDGIYGFKNHDFVSNVYHIVCSERALGKTTSALIIGMMMHQMYDVTIVYVRQTDDMIRPKNTSQLFNVVRECGYVEQITDGRWNGIYCFSRHFYYCNYDENGKIAEKDVEPFMSCVALSERFDIKSTWNTPKGDWIIFDEFISDKYYRDEFVAFMDILSTIIRSRTSARILLLSNTIDNESNYFYDFEIADSIREMRFGECMTIKTQRGTRIQVEIPTMDSIRRAEKESHNSLYFGFKNSKLMAITGGGWAIDSWQHPFGEFEVYFNKIYLKYRDGNMVKADIIWNENNQRIMVYFHKATKTYDDSIIITDGTPEDTREFNNQSFWWRRVRELIDGNLAMYQNNTIGNIVYKFYSRYN